MNVEDYLKRIKCEEFRQVNLENLKKLQQRHFQTFCFENLDMHMGKKIDYSLETTYDRLMNKSRGGYCLQLNTMFGWLLRHLGYEVFFTPCHIYYSFIKSYVRLPIHIILIVTLDNRQYYVDVGTSRDLDEPIEICLDKVQKGVHGSFKFQLIDDSFYELLKLIDNEWQVLLKFELEPKDFDYFKDMNDYVQTREHPGIFYRTVVVKHFENGMIYLIGNKFTEVNFKLDGDVKNTKELTLDECKSALKEKFNLIVDDSFSPVDNLDSYIKEISEKK